MQNPHDVACMVPIRQLLHSLRVRIRSSKRADCPFCRGNSYGTLSYTEWLWRCHRCNLGGDVFTLVRAVNRCDFPGALRFVAELAGIHLVGWNRDFPSGMDARKRHRKRLEDGAAKLHALEHALLTDCRDRIHKIEHTRLKISGRLAALIRGEPERFRGEENTLWWRLWATVVLLNTDLPTYTLLSFGSLDQRAAFVLQPELRDQIIAAVRWAGFVRTDDDRQIEVLA